MGLKNQSLLKLSNLTKVFGGKEVLRNIDLEVKNGEFIAVVGRSGCGKSTLLRMIAGLETVSSGGLTVNGQELNGRNQRAKIMFQDGRLLPWKNVYDNIGLGLKHNSQKEKIPLLLEQVGLSDRAQAWPSELSGGQQQRVALARALIHEPEILLLDEPLGALDAFTRIEMHQLIESLWREKNLTAILVTHDVEEAVALANRIILIEEGEIVMDLPVGLPYPRRKDHPHFAKLTSQILDRIMGKSQESLVERPIRLSKAKSLSLKLPKLSNN